MRRIEGTRTTTRTTTTGKSGDWTTTSHLMTRAFTKGRARMRSVKKWRGLIQRGKEESGAHQVTFAVAVAGDCLFFVAR